MSNREEIPKDVWDAAWKVLGQTMVGDVREPIKPDAIARAIMAATLAEREACARIADETANELDGANQILHSLVGRGIALAIRKRGEP